MNWKLWIAQGFGIGRIPVAPGTFGSILGFVLLAALLCTGSWTWVFAISICLVPISVWLCGEAEIILGKTDPGSVVLDEVIAIPFCYIVVIAFGFRFGNADMSTAQPSFLLHWYTPVVFILFRLFDVWKPWPVRQTQNLPGGFGVVTDDLVAAGYVSLVLACFFFAVSFIDLPVPH